MYLRILCWALFAAISCSSAAFSEEDGSFVLHEYWTCSDERMEALQKAARDIWAPVFDTLVADGMLLGWGHLYPSSTTQYESAEADGSESAPDHDWFVWFQTTSSDANGTMWEEFGRRLREVDPSDPRPWLYCDALKTVSYVSGEDSR